MCINKVGVLVCLRSSANEEWKGTFRAQFRRIVADSRSVNEMASNKTECCMPALTYIRLDCADRVMVESNRPV